MRRLLLVELDVSKVGGKEIRDICLVLSETEEVCVPFRILKEVKI